MIAQPYLSSKLFLAFLFLLIVSHDIKKECAYHQNIRTINEYSFNINSLKNLNRFDRKTDTFKFE